MVCNLSQQLSKIKFDSSFSQALSIGHLFDACSKKEPRVCIYMGHCEVTVYKCISWLEWSILSKLLKPLFILIGRHFVTNSHLFIPVILSNPRIPLSESYSSVTLKVHPIWGVFFIFGGYVLGCVYLICAGVYLVFWGVYLVFVSMYLVYSNLSVL